MRHSLMSNRKKPLSCLLVVLVISSAASAQSAGDPLPESVDLPDAASTPSSDPTLPPEAVLRAIQESEQTREAASTGGDEPTNEPAPAANGLTVIVERLDHGDWDRSWVIDGAITTTDENDNEPLVDATNVKRETIQDWIKDDH